MTLSESMTQHLKHIFAFLSVVILTLIATQTYACTCISKENQTTENELNNADLAVKGKIIAVATFDYYDTIAFSITGQNFDPNQSGYLIRKYKVYTLQIDTKFKATKINGNTIQIVTGYGDGDCGFEFEIGKDYIIYAETWKEKIVSVRHRKRKDKRRITESIIANKFYTDICRLTQESNVRELDKLKRLTK